MLSNDNIRQINDLIRKEIRAYDSWGADADDKSAALENIAKLQALLTPQPSRSDILAELADALVNVQQPAPQPPVTASIAVEILEMLRRK